MFGLGPLELVVILVIVIIVFGVGKLPEIGTGIGEGIRNFQKAYREAKSIEARDIETRAKEEKKD